MDYIKLAREAGMKEAQDAEAQDARRQSHKAMICLPDMEKAILMLQRMVTRPPDAPLPSEVDKAFLMSALGHILGHLYTCAEDHPQ